MTSSARAGQQRPRGRANGEGSIFPYRNGYAAYVWVTTPAGEHKRKYVYGKTREIVHGKWIELQAKAAKAPVPTVTPTLEAYLSSWLAEVIKPNRELATYDQYEILTRLYIVPSLGEMKVDRLRVRQVQTWLNNLAATCQCCAQGKDARRPKGKRRCCAAGQCCESYPGKRTVQAARNTLRAALSQAVVDEIVSRNVASLVQVPTPPKRRRKGSAWSVQEASRFLESARDDGDPLYAAYVLTLVLGLRKGEVLGLQRAGIDPAASEIDVSWQLQRIRGQLIHKKRTKADDDQSGGGLNSDDLVFTTPAGTNRDPRNFNRSFNSRCDKAGVRRIRVHDTRHTCASFLPALDVHPRVAMAILRHAQIAITMEIYTEVPDEVTRAALKRLGDQLSSRG